MDSQTRLNNYIIDLKELYLSEKEWNECYDNGYVPYTHSTDNYQKLMLELVDKQLEYLRKDRQMLGPIKKLTEYMFITLSPKDTVSIKTLYDKTIKMVKNKTILEYLFVFEQRSKDINNTYGIHMHLLIKHKFPKYSRLFKQLESTYKDTVGNIHNYNFLDIKHNDTNRDVLNRVEYMIGDKKDLDKQEKQNIDKQWRQRWNIAEYYGVVPEFKESQKDE